MHKKPLLAAGLALLLLVPACRSGTDHGAGPVEILFWRFGEASTPGDWISTAIERFNATHSDIQVSMEPRDWDTQRESLITTTIVGDGPDIIIVNQKHAAEFGDLGGLYPLERFSDFQEVKHRFLPNTMEEMAYNGKHYGLPILMLPFVMAVNRELLAAHNLAVPHTWEELKALGPVLKADGIHALTIPCGANGDAAYRFLALLYKAGGRALDDDWSRATFNGPAGVAVLEFLLDLKQQGFFPAASPAYAFGENTAHWATGKAALSVEGPWWENTVKEYDFDLSKLGLAPIPGPAERVEDNPPRTLLDMVMISITGYTQAPDAAWEVVKALYVEDPVWNRANPTTHGIPTHTAAYEEGVLPAYIDQHVLENEGRIGLSWPGHPAVSHIILALGEAVNMTMSGALQPKAALDVAADDVNDALADY